MMGLKKMLLVLTVLFLTTPFKAHAEDFNWDNVINAISKVESKGNPKAYNPNGDCAGLLQITKSLVNETNQILKSRKSKKRYTYADRYDAEKSKEMFILLQEHFNPEHNIEKAIKCWNAGFYSKNWKNRNAYYKKVTKYLI